MMSPGVETWYKYTLTNCTQITKIMLWEEESECWLFSQSRKTPTDEQFHTKRRKDWRVELEKNQNVHGVQPAWLIFVTSYMIHLFLFHFFPFFPLLCSNVWFVFVFLYTIILHQDGLAPLSSNRLTDYWLYVSLCVNPVIVNPNSPKESQIPFKFIWAQVLHLREKQDLFGYVSRKCSRWIIFMLFSDHYLIKLTISEWKTFQYFSNLI